MRPRHFLLLATCLALSCLRPTEERVERDREVGRAEREGLVVEVDEGLATVRSLSDGTLSLWGSAPGFAFTLRSETASRLTVEIQNCLPDAELRVLSGATLLSAFEDQSTPTRKAWRLELPPGDSRLALAAPDQDAEQPFQFALLSDIQEAIDEVGDIFARINREADVRFLLGAGDLTQQGTRDQLERFQRELLALKIPYFTTLGNHELGTKPVLFHDYFGRGNFQFDFHGVTFTLLDDASAMLDPTVYDWLDDWLARARDRVHIVAMHIPPVDPIGVRNGSWASRNEADKLLGRLAEGRVDLTLYGHIHSYYSFDNAGIPAYISGGGGAIPERFDRVGRHFMVFTTDAHDGITAKRLVEVD